MTIGSFNCRGHGLDRILYLRKLTQLCDVVHIGEHGIGSQCRAGYSFILLTGAGIDVGYGNAGEDC